MTNAGQKFRRMATLPEGVRNERLMPTALLEKLQRITIKSSLMVAKLKMQKDKADTMRIQINYEDSITELP